MTDDFYEARGARGRSNAVIAIVVMLVLGMIALPFVWAFTGWL